MASTVPHLLRRLDIAKQWITRYPHWSPRELLAGNATFFPTASSLTVKQSRTSRFFMYEEHAGTTKLRDNNDNGPTQVLQRSPLEVANLLHREGDTSDENENDKNSNAHYYWTSPVADVAPNLLKQHLQGYESLHEDQPLELLDPRGPSLWMGTAGSATQAHYDVADNVIVQLFGTKRIRCFHPDAATALHVFPDAHPRARKSQVNFDMPDYDRFAQFASLPLPVLDVVLEPGDALRIPAFWFHHVENGSNDDNAPSVSLNVFALSKSMMTAQAIFRDASRPFGFLKAAPVDSAEYEVAISALRALGWGLFEGLGMQGTARDFIRTALLDTRYVPLRSGGTEQTNKSTAERRELTAEEENQIASCIARILPQFAVLRAEQNNGIVSLVACHLLELWAVELVGAPSVADAWETVLLLGDEESEGGRD